MSSSEGFPIINRACDEHRRRHARCPVNCAGRLLLMKQYQKWQKSGSEDAPPISLRRRGRKRKNPEAGDKKSDSPSDIVKRIRQKRKIMNKSDDNTESYSGSSSSDEEYFESESQEKLDHNHASDRPSSTSPEPLISLINVIELRSRDVLHPNNRFQSSTNQKINDVAPSSRVKVEYIKGEEEEILNELSNSDEDERSVPSESLEDSQNDMFCSQFLVEEYQSPEYIASESPLSPPSNKAPSSFQNIFEEENVPLDQKFKQAICAKQLVLNKCLTEREDLLQKRKSLLDNLQQTESDLTNLNDVINNHTREKNSIENRLNRLEQIETNI